MESELNEVVDASIMAAAAAAAAAAGREREREMLPVVAAPTAGEEEGTPW